MPASSADMNRLFPLFRVLNLCRVVDVTHESPKLSTIIMILTAISLPSFLCCKKTKYSNGKKNFYTEVRSKILKIVS